MVTFKNTCKIVTLLMLSALFLVGIPQAQAHARLLKADPAPNSSVAAPKTIQLHFDDELIAKFSNFKLTDVNGAVVAITPVDTQDTKTLAATPVQSLTPGLYTVSWVAASQDDGHKMKGTFSFTVK